MKNYHFGLLICFKVVIFVHVYGDDDSNEITASDQSETYELPEIITLHKSSKSNSKQEIFVNLKPKLDSVLANKNLPIALVHSNRDLEFISSSVMEDIGPFFMYQDLESCSAAVYFHKRQQFDGTVDNRYIINALPYNVKTKKVKPSRCNMIETREMKHPEILPKGSSSSVDVLEVIDEKKAQEIEKKKWINIKSKLEYPNDVYIETLVIINYDMVDAFHNDYAVLVSNILVTFNTVDLLYASIDRPKIKINIAGIMIGVKRESFPALLKQKCYESGYQTDQEEMEGNCTASAVKSILSKHEKAFPPSSYDVVVFLTNHNLHSYSLNRDGNIETHPIDGVAFTPEHVHSGYKKTLDDTRIVVATYFYDPYQSFAVIAHEMAHLFNALHDQGELRKNNGECNANLMRTDGTFCTKCLKFSDTTTEQLRSFFGTRQGCLFLNKPRSLHYPPQPQMFLSDDEQCQCYGFMSAKKFEQSFWDQLKMTFQSNTYCRKLLQCVNPKTPCRASNPIKTTFPMDGTPCDSNKVCWDKKCTKVVY